MWKPRKAPYGNGHQIIKVNEKQVAIEVGKEFYASEKEAQAVCDKLNGAEHGAD